MAIVHTDQGITKIPMTIHHHDEEGEHHKADEHQHVDEHAREDGIRVIFVQPQFSTKSAALVAREIGGQVATADPLAEDWPRNLRVVANTFKAVLI